MAQMDACRGRRCADARLFRLGVPQPRHGCRSRGKAAPTRSPAVSATRGRPSASSPKSAASAFPRAANGVTNRYWYLLDGWGSVVGLVDGAGNVLNQYAYAVWGEPPQVSESVPQQLRYRGYLVEVKRVVARRAMWHAD
jgi:hypothetical protein